jgi:signal transduction histidine kinase
MINLRRNYIGRNTLRFLRFTIAILLALEISLSLFYFLLHPPIPSFAFMTILMSITSVISLVVAYMAYRLGWMYRSSRLQWTMLGGYGIAIVFVLLNMGLIARVMFTSVQDVILTGILLLFTSGIVMSFGFFLSQTLTDRMEELAKAAEEIAQGNLAMRVPVIGNDELARLGNTFNDMAIQLDQMDLRQRDMRNMRNEHLTWIGHDLRTPLTSIRAILEALTDELVDDPATIQRYLATAQKETRYLSRLIDDLFDMSQMEAGGLQLDYQENSLTDLISDTIESFTELAFKQGIILEGSVQKEIDPVYMDAQLIGRVLTNLTSNALRFTPSGGTVNIVAKRINKRIQVEVADNGDGIKPEDIPLVFERFYRGEKSRSRRTGGTGLGLAIARGIVEAHGGQIRAESTVGVGTRMIFTIPGKSKE